MPTTQHQTVRLSRGKHSSPQDGACVMELASLLAGEPFSDHPKSVCPIIAAFLRGYNDAVDSERRQDLYRYASEAVGSRGGPDVVNSRTTLLEQRTRELREARHRWSLLQRIFGLEIQPSFGSDLAFAVRTLSDRGQHGHAEALALVDELLAIGREAPASAGTYRAANAIASPAATPMSGSSSPSRDAETSVRC